MIMRIFFTNSLMKFTSSLSDLSVDYKAANRKDKAVKVFMIYDGVDDVRYRHSLQFSKD